MSHAAIPESTNRVSNLELFFDLVFVFTVTQVTSLVVTAHSVLDLLRAALVLLVVWWMYGGYAWLTNNVGSRSASARLLLLAAMGAFLIMALSVPGAFGRDGLAFGLAYLAVVFIHTALFTQAPGNSARAIFGIAYFNFGMALLILAAAFAPPGWREALWTLAILVVMLAGLLRRERGFTLNASHFAERHGLVILIALGESVVAIGVGAAGTAVRGPLVLSAALALGLAVTLWWSYFAHTDERAEAALQQADQDHRTRLGLSAYGYAFVVMLAGIVVVAAGIKSVVAHPHGVYTPAAWWLACGLALFLAGEALFCRLMGIRGALVRAVTAGLTLASVALGLSLGALPQLASLTALLVVMLLVDRPGGIGFKSWGRR